MLVRKDRQAGEGYQVPIGQAAYPAPFKGRLEFNPPVHENWNIVHIGMRMPESRQIYVCADNCMRGVVLTAAEMNASDRFSYVVLEEKDLYEGNLEDVTIEGVSSCIEKLEERPPVVMVFLVCLHHFIGTDTGRVYRELEKRFPDICFLRCWMDPIMQKLGLTPDQKLRKAMLDPLEEPQVRDQRAVSFLLDNFPLEEESGLYRHLTERGIKVRQITDCQTFEEFKGLASSGLYVTRSAPGLYGLEKMARRTGGDYLYLPCAVSYEEIRQETEDLCGRLGIPVMDFEEREKECDRALERALALIGDTPVAIDYLGVPRPLGLAGLLLDKGFNVTRVYLDAVSPEEEKAFLDLQERYPDLLLCSTIHVSLRLDHGDAPETLAIGPKAAWLTGTDHFVNLVEMNGMWGYDALIRLSSMMEEAFLHAGDPRDVLPRKGFGCESCI